VSLHTWSALASLFKETKNGEKKRKDEAHHNHAVATKNIYIQKWLQ
jgi:hypothetical protein